MQSPGSWRHGTRLWQGQEEQSVPALGAVTAPAAPADGFQQAESITDTHAGDQLDP